MDSRLSVCPSIRPSVYLFIPSPLLPLLVPMCARLETYYNIDIYRYILYPRAHTLIQPQSYNQPYPHSSPPRGSGSHSSPPIMVRFTCSVCVSTYTQIDSSRQHASLRPFWQPVGKGTCSNFPAPDCTGSSGQLTPWNS